jgi:Fe2+ or Zn2+ uptake regulation protein
MKTKVYDLQKYKRAKLIVKDIQSILPVIIKSYESLKPYMKYRTVMDTLDVLNDSKLILEIHLKNEKKIIDNNGLSEDE